MSIKRDSEKSALVISGSPALGKTSGALQSLIRATLGGLSGSDGRAASSTAAGPTKIPQPEKDAEEALVEEIVVAPKEGVLS